MNLENFEKRCDEIREENEKYLQIFKEDNRNLSPKTISRHVDNVSFYINEYLLRNEPLTRVPVVLMAFWATFSYGSACGPPRPQ